MCWSLPVSVAFAVLEAFSLAFLVWRCFYKKDASKIETQQRYVLPLLFSIFCIETLEAFTWAESTGMRHISEAANATCTARNTTITRIVAIVLFCQPFASVWASRNMGDARNRDLLAVPQHLALLTSVAMIGSLVVGEAFGRHLNDISVSHYIGFHGLHTCSWIGANGGRRARPAPRPRPSARAKPHRAAPPTDPPRDAARVGTQAIFTGSGNSPPPTSPPTPTPISSSASRRPPGGRCTL